MKKIITLVTFFICLQLHSNAQMCFGINMKSGMGFEMLSYNAKDKPMGKLLYTIKEVINEGGATVLKIELQSFNTKDKLESANSYSCRCKGNEIMVDMTSMMAAQENPMLKDAKMTFTSTDLTYNDNYTIGANLKDASLKGEGEMGGGMKLEYSMDMKNRKVESQENITVPSGTYNAYKITSDMTVSTKTLMNISFDFQTVSYRAPKILWDVKTETYRKGKLMSYTVLSKVF